MSRKSLPELITEAGFEPGEFDKSRNLRASVCNGTATGDQLAEYSQYAHKWDAYARLLGERDQLDAVERSAPDPCRHSGDTALGEAFRSYRDGQGGRPVAVRQEFVEVMTADGLIRVPAKQALPQHRGPSSGHERIAAGLTAASKKR